MKKILTTSLSLLLALCMMVAMTACGSSSSKPDANAKTDTSAKADTSAAAGSTSAADGSTSADPSDDVSKAESELTYGYMGTINDDGTTVYMAMNDDVSVCAFVALSPDATENVSFIGQSEVNDAGQVTIHDTVQNVDFTFGVTKGEAEDTYDLDMGDLGTAKVAAVDVSEVLDAYETIDAATDAVQVN